MLIFFADRLANLIRRNVFCKLVVFFHHTTYRDIVLDRYLIQTQSVQLLLIHFLKMDGGEAPWVFFFTERTHNALHLLLDRFSTKYSGLSALHGYRFTKYKWHILFVRIRTEGEQIGSNASLIEATVKWIFMAIGCNITRLREMRQCVLFCGWFTLHKKSNLTQSVLMRNVMCWKLKG